MVPVSYTHLDVYKRQVVTLQEAIIQNLKNMNAAEENRKYMQEGSTGRRNFNKIIKTSRVPFY